MMFSSKFFATGFRSAAGSSPSGPRRRSTTTLWTRHPSPLSSSSSWLVGTRSSSTRRLVWAAGGLICMTASSSRSQGVSFSTFAYCQGLEDDHDTTTTTTEKDDDDDIVLAQPFTEDVLEYDHYNGVIVHLEKLPAVIDPLQFGRDLATALTLWKAERRKGIWIHCPEQRAELIPYCTNHGFQFHFVKHWKKKENDKTTTMLILSQWLPSESDSRLPLGPTHQIGVGVVVLNPKDPSQMLCVQEKTGPAAAYGLWKIPTGLLDPNEDIPDAAKRELMEETGLCGELDGILCFRQAHSPSRSSDLFFVCHMTLTPSDQSWTMQEDEIADIQWMSVEDFCNQDRWQGSPVYEKLNDSIRQVSKLVQQHGGDARRKLIAHERLPLGFGGTQATNALFRSQL